MVARHYRELIAWQLAEELKLEIFELIRSSDAASKDHRYKSQLLDATTSITANIAEGFLRFSSGELKRFLDFALGSLAEAENRLNDGINLGYFASETAENALRLARRCLVATVRLKQSQKPPPRKR